MSSFAVAGPFHHCYDDCNSPFFNYGYNHNHRVSLRERARWQAAHRYDNRR
ncbi:hypothetical protein [Hymenobacter glaciei]|uniref:hypothetical protein n=1 Tax=Hymenobacter glaciei TaxID=877209 RepID=UPI0031ECA824